ncbi:hypothetical protein D3C72_1777540 [compost metagenome]
MAPLRLIEYFVDWNRLWQWMQFFSIEFCVRVLLPLQQLMRCKPVFSRFGNGNFRVPAKSQNAFATALLEILHAPDLAAAGLHCDVQTSPIE